MHVSQVDFTSLGTGAWVAWMWLWFVIGANGYWQIQDANKRARDFWRWLDGKDE